MAVQAQCPSNILFLNRNVQESKNTNTLGNNNNDYTLQSRGGGGAGGFVTDQSHMVLNNGVMGINPRKRGRETLGTPSQISPFSIQNQPSSQNHIIDLSQIHTSPPHNVVSTGLRLAFGNQQQQQLHHQQQQQHQHQQSMSTTQSSVLFSLLSEELAAQIRQQRDDIDNFLQVQGEQLRRTLAEKRQRHYRALLGAAEESLARQMREKEVEVEKALRRHAELEARASQLGAETQLWQARAKAQEAAAISLQAQLQQAMMKNCNAPPPLGCSVEETGCEAAAAAEDAESAYIDPDRVVVTESTGNGPICKACRKRVASVVLLPCRHLCLCSACDAMAPPHSCPLCSSFRSSSVEVFLS
ncbi:BOI-related E3 ubiquitin-protein ligase 1 [Impatiens glandulifera]|uniref:BOI-related E3 ubiquitin-protein ligase 1 n=1 Tax=Impatiens glandulifera TaxID=253017 RepID=UPI001FB08839|nr:BOI-related E3 ubiquitin-protein ligase 1 [Impatiens glandulifera]